MSPYLVQKKQHVLGLVFFFFSFFYFGDGETVGEGGEIESSNGVVFFWGVGWGERERDR